MKNLLGLFLVSSRPNLFVSNCFVPRTRQKSSNAKMSCTSKSRSSLLLLSLLPNKMEISSQLQEALKIPDRLPAKQFAQVLRRLAIALKTRDAIPFSEDETQILLEQFEMTPSDFDTMLSSCQYILQQSATFSFTSEKIEMYCQQCGISEGVTQCYSAVWDAEGDDLIENLKQRTMSENVLDNTDWRLNLQAADLEKANQRKPVMLIDLNVTNSKPVSIQFDHEQLTAFYNQIEMIQQQIDKMT